MMPNANMMRQMQARLNKIQEELEAKTVEASAGGGAVTVVANGQLRVKSVSIDPEVVDAQDVEMLQDLVIAAVNEALGKAQELAAQELGAITGGLKIPGM
ncbi:MAG TPA: YbaB/EbfC family nucleoid-associated protein [Chloroflexota bacterium]|jgi:DNA-binding YbaB/EbfC family protein|nr:YbaB/EbfC family nucleoid-associated protein [Chloroflexota bacterium]